MDKLNLRGVSTAVWVSAIMTVLVAVNILLGYMGVHLIPLTEGDIAKIVDGAIVLITAAVWAWGWWKNNSITNAAQVADVILAEIKGEPVGERVKVVINPNEEDEANDAETDAEHH